MTLKTETKKKAFFFMIICVLFWGFSFISIKVSMQALKPMTLGALRFSIAVVCLYIMKLINDMRLTQRGEAKETLSFKDLPLLILTSITGVSLYFYFENNGVDLTGASEASIIIGFIPVLSMLCDVILLKTNIAPRQWIGTAFSVSGVIMVSGISISLSGNPLGYVFMICSVICWVVYGFLTRPLFTRRSQIYVIFWQNFFGLAGLCLFAVFEKNSWMLVDGVIIGHVLFLAVFCSALCYMLYAYALDVLGVSVTSLFINCTPVITAVASFFVLKERLTLLQWIGAFFVMGGVTAASWPRSR
ncbi:MAG: DMT family transporter [Spirochaetaceae bacterium]|jgi:drug/metabolite transporter (DMT)-like permease|nr:DMT family transporter [Spirochaetaceae bacterium]